jgi:hypothetical protein
MAMIIGLLATTPDKHDASYIFTKVTDQTGWGNDGLAFMLGLLSVQWVNIISFFNENLQPHSAQS